MNNLPPPDPQKLHFDKYLHGLTNFLIVFVGSMILSTETDGFTSAVAMILAALFISFGKEYHDYTKKGRTKESCIKDLIADGIGVIFAIVLFISIGGI